LRSIFTHPLSANQSYKIGVVTGILHPTYGGPSTVVQMHIKGLSAYSTIEIFCVAKRDEVKHISNTFPNAKVFPRTFPDRWFRGKGLKDELIKSAVKLDIIHAHMLWDYPVYAAWRASKLARKPLVITTHGSLSAPWRYKAIHKRIYRRLILDRILNDTSFIQVLNTDEASACREFGVPCNVRVIPNGIPSTEFHCYRDPAGALRKWPQLRDKRILLYLGRLWSEKGLDILPEAWAETLKDSKNALDWLLVIAGPDYRNYQIKLLSRIKSLGIEPHVLFTGLIDVKLKESLLAVAECFVLPSHGEGFSMALLEAMAAGLPALYTTECHFSELAANGGGWEISAQKNELVQWLCEIVSFDQEALQAVGKKAWILGRERYTLESVTEELVSLYKEAISLQDKQ